MLEILIQRIDPELPLPRYALTGDAGVDLYSRVDLDLDPGERKLVPTGIALAIPDGFVGLVHPRSGLAARQGLSMVNAPGTIDSGYRGEIFVNLVNLDRSQPIHLNRGDRIAQLVFQRFEQVMFVEAEELPESERGSEGHGSTGISPNTK